MVRASTFSSGLKGPRPTKASYAVSERVKASSALPSRMSCIFATDAAVDSALAANFSFLVRRSARPAPYTISTPAVAACSELTREWVMRYFRYSRWDGSQELEPFTANDVMEHLADKLLDDRDLWSALREMLQRGAQLPSGRQMPGLRDLLERLRQ